MSEKILILRFSSFGDIIQTLSVPAALKALFPESEIHWVTLTHFQDFPRLHPQVDRVWALDKKDKSLGLKKLIHELKSQNYTHIYDAHNNLRSHRICWALRGLWGLKSLLSFKKLHFLRRSRYPLRRFLLFRFHINLYPKPFVGQWALLEPLKKWGVSLDLPPTPQVFFSNEATQKAQSLLLPLRESASNVVVVALSPSASQLLKRWPVPHWKELIQMTPSHWRFVLLGGPEDDFIEEIYQTAPDRGINLAGKLTLQESSALVDQVDLLITADTGLLHIAEQRGRPCIALMGPAPFGYPGRKSTTILELDLDCRPCSKHGQGPCVNAVYQKCLVEISPQQVYQTALSLLAQKKA